MSPTDTLLEQLGLNRNSPEFARLARHTGGGLVDAWRSPNALANDRAWLSSRIVTDPEHRTVLSLAFLGAAGARVGVASLEKVIAFVAADLLDPDKDTMSQTALIASRTLEAAEAKKLVRISEDGTLFFEHEDAIPYGIVWLTLHCVLITLGAGCPLKAAAWARHTFQLIERLPGENRVAEFLRDSIPFDDFETAWLEVITRHAAKA